MLNLSFFRKCPFLITARIVALIDTYSSNGINVKLVFHIKLFDIFSFTYRLYRPLNDQVYPYNRFLVEVYQLFVFQVQLVEDKHFPNTI